MATHSGYRTYLKVPQPRWCDFRVTYRDSGSRREEFAASCSFNVTVHSASYGEIARPTRKGRSFSTHHEQERLVYF